MKILKCGIQNEVVLEHSSDIMIIIQNNSNETVSVLPGENCACCVTYDIIKHIYIILSINNG